MSKLTFKETLSSSDDYSSSDTSSDESEEYLKDQETVHERTSAIEENRPSKRPRNEETVGAKSVPDKNKKDVKSVFLSNFLSKKKMYSIPEPPEFPPMNDDILREFNASSRLRNHLHPIDRDRKLSITSTDSITYDSDSSDDVEYESEVLDRSSNLTLQLFNLPYTMTEDQVSTDIIDKQHLSSRLMAGKRCMCA
jgi:hypothetical protein